MVRPEPAFDEIPHADVADSPERSRRPVLSDGRASGRFPAVFWSFAALFSAMVAAMSLTLSIRDDEADLLVGFSVAMQVVSALLLIGAGVAAARVKDRRWPYWLLTIAVAVISIALTAWAYETAAVVSVYIP